MTFKIDKNIPTPPGTPRTKYPFGQMEVGDSFFISDETKNAQASASNWGTRYHQKYTTRTVTEDGVKGVRVWRIK